MGHDLSLRDIKFLRTIRDINANPGAYEYTDQGELPANKRSIAEASELSPSEVGYRLGGNHSRGFEDGDDALIIDRDPTINEDTNTFGPRSAKLSERGVELLSEIEESGVVDGSSFDEEPELVKQLRARVKRLEDGGVGGEDTSVDTGELYAEIESIQTQLDQIETRLDNEFGAVDEAYAENLEKIINRVPAIYYMLNVVMGLDLDSRVMEGQYESDKEVFAERNRVFELLSESDQHSPDGEEQSKNQDRSGNQTLDEVNQTKPNTEDRKPPSFSNLDG